MESRDYKSVTGLAEMCVFLNKCWESCLLHTHMGQCYLYYDSLTQLQMSGAEIAGNDDEGVVSWEWREPTQTQIDTLYSMFL